MAKSLVYIPKLNSFYSKNERHAVDFDSHPDNPGYVVQKCLVSFHCCSVVSVFVVDTRKGPPQ